MASDLPALDKALSLFKTVSNTGRWSLRTLKRSAFVSVTILTSGKKNVITQDAMDSFMNSIETVAHEFVNDAKLVAENRKSWRDFVERYGHLRPGTYDITSEAYSDNEEKYLRPVADNAKNSSREDPEVIAAGWYRERTNFSLHSLALELSEPQKLLRAFYASQLKVESMQSSFSHETCLSSSRSHTGVWRIAWLNKALVFAFTSLGRFFA